MYTYEIIENQNQFTLRIFNRHQELTFSTGIDSDVAKLPANKVLTGF